MFQLESIDFDSIKYIVKHGQCKMQSTCKLAFIWTKQTYPYNQGYIYVGQDQAIRTNKDIYVVKR